MSEKNPYTESREQWASAQEAPPQHERHTESAEDAKLSPEASVQSIEEIARKVEQQAISSRELQPDTTERRHHPVIVNKHVKDTSYNRTLLRLRKKLNPADKVVSKMIHSPVLDKPSEVASKTVARPSGILGGSIVATVGTLALFWTVRSYGYEYNYLAVATLFAAGMIIGLGIEALVKLIRFK